jgi:hypothetical protein
MKIDDNSNKIDDFFKINESNLKKLAACENLI